MDNHKFIDCGLVRAICDETGNLSALAEVIKRGDKDTPSTTPTARRTTTNDRLQQLIQENNEENNSLQAEQLKDDMESEYDSGSQHSSSTFNDTKNTVEPYSNILFHNQYCRMSKTCISILRPPQSYLKPQTTKTVTFHPSITNQQLH
jgi:glutamine synthetase adenylyltransferase